MKHYSQIDAATEIAKCIVEVDDQLDQRRLTGEGIVPITAAELVLLEVAGYVVNLCTGECTREERQP